MSPSPSAPSPNATTTTTTTTTLTAHLVIDTIDAVANCDQTYFLRCFKSCVSFQTWTQTGPNISVQTTPGMFTGYSCDCQEYAYELRVVDGTQGLVATGPPSFPLSSAFRSIQSKRAFDGRMQTVWVLQQSSASCSASYCINTPDSDEVLGVRPSPCFYGSAAYYVQSFWWAMVFGAILACCCCCFARRRSLRDNNSNQQLVGLGDEENDDQHHHTAANYELTTTTTTTHQLTTPYDQDDLPSETFPHQRRMLIPEHIPPSPDLAPRELQPISTSTTTGASPMPQFVLGSFGSPTKDSLSRV